MRLAQISRRLTGYSQDQVADRLSDASSRLGEVSGNAYERVSAAGQAARSAAQAAYRAALAHPKTSIGSIILAAALVGGVLWYVFGREEPASRRGSARRVRAGTRSAHRRRARAARAAAAG
jgi:hypothetical protein